MEINETNKLTAGTWANMLTEEAEKKDKVEFEINKPQVVIMKCSKPREIQWDTGVFYVFDVEHEEKDKAIVTSAWTLLKGLKNQEPFEGIVLEITKVMDKGKQTFKVEKVELEQIKM